jgi:hypothetical protein
LTGGDEQGKQLKNNAPNSKIQNCYFPGSKISQIFTGARTNYQEHISATNTQKYIKDRSQKFKQNCSFQNFQEFFGSG